MAGRTPAILLSSRALAVRWKTWSPRNWSSNRLQLQGQRTFMNKTFDFAVVGAGVFGAWTAHCLRLSGSSVVLVDAYGPGNSRASSAGETRVIRMGYGPDELYMRWSMRSLRQWRSLFTKTGDDLFHPTGVLWISNDDDLYTRQMFDVVTKAGINCEAFSA